MDAVVDERIQRGMERQLALRRGRLNAGERSIGWKVGLGSPSAMESLGIRGPLIGFLTDRVVVASGSNVSIKGWMKPAIEPEIAVYIGRELGLEDNRRTVRAAVEAIGPAIELADVDPPPTDVEAILAGNIFNRHVILGEADRSRAGGALGGLTARIHRDNAELASTNDLQALTGDLIEIVRHVGAVLSHFGEALRPGDVVIAGSIVPPIWAETSVNFRYELEPLDVIAVHLAA